jgi:DNA-directed RNA polymerase subunit beta'
VKIRSVLTCEQKYGVCGKCYGRDLARGTPSTWAKPWASSRLSRSASRAPSSPCAPFHIGGTAQVVDQSFLESSFEGGVEIRNRTVVRDSHGPASWSWAATSRSSSSMRR